MYGVVTKAGLWDCSAQSKKLFFHNEGTQQRSQSKWAFLSKLSSFYLIFPHANQIIPIYLNFLQCVSPQLLVYIFEERGPINKNFETELIVWKFLSYFYTFAAL